MQATWKPATKKYKTIFENLDTWWNPFLVWFICILPYGGLSYFIANFITMLDYRAEAISIDKAIIFDVGGEQVGDPNSLP